MGCGQSSSVDAQRRETPPQQQRRETPPPHRSPKGNPDGRRSLMTRGTSPDIIEELTSVTPNPRGPVEGDDSANDTSATSLQIGLLSIPTTTTSGHRHRHATPAQPASSGGGSRNTSSHTSPSSRHKNFSVTAEEFDGGRTPSGAFLESTGEWKEMRKRLEGDGYLSPMMSVGDHPMGDGAPLQLLRGSADINNVSSAASQFSSSISTMEGGNISADEKLVQGLSNGRVVVRTNPGGAATTTTTRATLPTVDVGDDNSGSSGTDGTAPDVASLTMTENPFPSNPSRGEPTKSQGDLLSQTMTLTDLPPPPSGGSPTPGRGRQVATADEQGACTAVSSPKGSFVSGM